MPEYHNMSKLKTEVAAVRHTKQLTDKTRKAGQWADTELHMGRLKGRWTECVKSFKELISDAALPISCRGDASRHPSGSAPGARSPGGATRADI